MLHLFTFSVQQRVSKRQTLILLEDETVTLDFIFTIIISLFIVDST